ncbi:MAG: metal-dependent hydrolase, partial [Flavobacteriaceae bacterium]|nr:metal-dependent hydrolase [Flavobacteriaceae bacterium]
MATIMSHAIVAGIFYKIFVRKQNRLALRLCILGSILPDFDVVGFAFGISYGDMLGHRGFTHSIIFAVFFAAICIFYFQREALKTKLKFFLLFFTSIMSHGIFDMLTNGGLGVGLFIPFSPKRYFFSFTPLEVSPIGRNFFSDRGLVVMQNEFLYVIA